MKIIQGVIYGPEYRKRVLPLPDEFDQPISQTWTICIWDTELGEYEYIETDKLPEGLHWQEDNVRYGLESLDNLDEAHMPKNWSVFTKNTSRTKVRVATVKDETIKKGGDPNFTIPKPAHSFALKLDDE